ncbi:hypothetical protein CsatA_004650 [Cannabis sativa]
MKGALVGSDNPTIDLDDSPINCVCGVFFDLHLSHFRFLIGYCKTNLSAWINNNIGSMIMVDARKSNYQKNIHRLDETVDNWLAAREVI